MFPDRQQGPHREWKDEISFLDAIFPNGSAYTVGKVNGDHWLLYMTGPAGGSAALASPEIPTATLSVAPTDLTSSVVPSTPDAPEIDYTIEILMTHLSPEARDPFFTPSSVDESSASSYAANLSNAIGVSGLFPPKLTMLDAYSFTPCGYSSNALLKWGDTEGDAGGEGYYTIHVTPEEGWSYASFECNVPLAHARPDGTPSDNDQIPDLKTLVRRVVRIFRPGTITLTLFISCSDNERTDGITPIEEAHRAFRAALTTPFALGGNDATSDEDIVEVKDQRKQVYRRTDKINYEFGGYNLAFASFELCG
jgi:S-adenosylmethionine decarboxylase